jgi:hypothetical protein
MNVQREELLRLVGELPETEVPAVLDDVRRRVRVVGDKSWSPAWFAAGQDPRLGGPVEGVLGDGFGRPA